MRKQDTEKVCLDTDQECCTCILYVQEQGTGGGDVMGKWRKKILKPDAGLFRVGSSDISHGKPSLL